MTLASDTRARSPPEREVKVRSANWKVSLRSSS
jgi:hypothetical protein